MSNARLHALRVFVLLIIAATAVQSCGGALTTRHIRESELRANPKIAVIPFDNYTDQDQVAAKITAYFEATMAGRREFTVIENGATFEALRRLRIRSATVLRQGQIDSLARALEADYLLAGSVLEYREVGDKFLVQIPQISINARLIDGKTGTTVWTGVANDSGDRKELLFGLGAIKSAEELSRRMVESMVQDLQSLFR